MPISSATQPAPQQQPVENVAPLLAEQMETGEPVSPTPAESARPGQLLENPEEHRSSQDDEGGDDNAGEIQAAPPVAQPRPASPARQPALPSAGLEQLTARAPQPVPAVVHDQPRAFAPPAALPLHEVLRVDYNRSLQDFQDLMKGIIGQPVDVQALEGLRDAVFRLGVATGRDAQRLAPAAQPTVQAERQPAVPPQPVYQPVFQPVFQPQATTGGYTGAPWASADLPYVRTATVLPSFIPPSTAFQQMAISAPMEPPRTSIFARRPTQAADSDSSQGRDSQDTDEETQRLEREQARDIERRIDELLKKAPKFQPLTALEGDDPANWFYYARTYLQHRRIPSRNPRTVAWVASAFTGPARDWWVNLIRQHPERPSHDPDFPTQFPAGNCFSVEELEAAYKAFFQVPAAEEITSRKMAELTCGSDVTAFTQKFNTLRLTYAVKDDAELL